MTFDDVVIQYHGFQPTPAARSYVETMMREIHEESPYGATLKASFSRSKYLFKGTIRISSAAGPFFASASGPGLLEVTKLLLERMRRRLSKWKSKRFRREGLKDLFSKHWFGKTEESDQADGSIRETVA